MSADLHAELKARDPETASRLNASDRQRILRALEVLAATDRPLASFLGARAAPALAPHEWAGLYLAPDRAELYRRIDARFDAMLAKGALDEVAALMKRRLDPALPVMRAHGVPHLIAHLEGRITLAQAAERSKLDTRHYAKRQFTWARRQMTGFRWVAPEEAVEAGARALAGVEARARMGVDRARRRPIARASGELRRSIPAFRARPALRAISARGEGDCASRFEADAVAGRLLADASRSAPCRKRERTESISNTRASAATAIRSFS